LNDFKDVIDLANAGLIKSGGFAQLSDEVFLRDFAGDPAKARILYAVQGRISDTLFRDGRRRPSGAQSRAGMPFPRKTGWSRPNWSSSWLTA